MTVMRMAHADANAADAKLSPGTLKRVWSFARPYKSTLIGFVITLVIGSVVGIVPSLIFRQMLDHIIPNGDRGALALWSLAILGVGILRGSTDLVGRWWSARIGEGLIFDLRTALFDHIQRMPIGFFSRTRTGALTNRYPPWSQT